MVVRAGSLHPLGYSDPRFIGADFGDSEIAKSGAFFRDENLLGITNDGEIVRIHPRDE